MDGIIGQDEMVDMGEDGVWVSVSTDVFTANVLMDCCKIPIEVE